MAKSVLALINPAMLVWARESAHLTPEAAAHSAGIPAEKLTACEESKAQLTFAQLMKIAQAYKRPVSLFYLKTPPAGWTPIKDFRRVRDAEGGFSPRLTYAIRLARERRELALSLREELNEPVQQFRLSATVRADIEDLGNRIRTFLGISDAQQQRWGRRAFDGWRIAMEAKDILVFVVPRLPIDEMRGIAVAEAQMPLILVNARDRTNGRTFTLLHEFCHLVVRQSGVSGIGGDSDDAPSATVETFCNAVAAATLMPKDWILSEVLVVRKGATKTWSDDELDALALRFGVSPEAVLRRLLTLGRTNKTFYEGKRPAFMKRYEDLSEETSSGGPAYHLQVLSQLGRAFTRLIFQGYYERRLTLRDVSQHLNMQVKYVPAMESAAFGFKSSAA
ncbi:MAG: ImmA/IrrE family metallo-endopeptidase [Xanthobacteraceae bacterium]|jgi:Zn-dependent peptidase ImmA (M78 family)